ncbi:hypothetical protein [Elioraea sp.]|uniref:hypothetical protein n=1 Tax=Elioraea sp. TaxID=2185103 RepID=UPI0025BC48DE|nr:hypothetical protein [Elioraea sp.]
MPKRLVVVSGGAADEPPPVEIGFGEAVRAAAERLIAQGCAVAVVIGQTPTGTVVTIPIPEAAAVTAGLIRACFDNEENDQ